MSANEQETTNARQELWAIVRYDGFLVWVTHPSERFTIKEIVRSLDLAEAEVRRLNAIVAEQGKEVRYLALPARDLGR